MRSIRDIIVSVADIPMGQKVADQLKKVKWIKIFSFADRTFMVHQGGKIEIKNKIPSNTLRRSVYGAAKVSMAIGYPTPKWALEMRLKNLPLEDS